jgi:hypothetical protein
MAADLSVELTRPTADDHVREGRPTTSGHHRQLSDSTICRRQYAHLDVKAKSVACAALELHAALAPARSVAFVDRLAVLDGLDHLDVLYSHRFHLQRVLVEDHQVGQLAGLQRTLGRLLAVLLRHVDGLRL